MKLGITALIVSSFIFLTGCSSPLFPGKTPLEEKGTVIQSDNIKSAVVEYINAIPNTETYKISETKAQSELLSNPSQYVVIDIRQASAYAAGHIPGAVNVPFGSDIATHLDKIRAYAQGKTAIVYCYTGQTAGQTVSLFNMDGINARSLNFGFGGEPNKGWAGYGFATTTEKVEFPNTEAPAADKDIDNAVKSYFNNMPRDSHKISATALNAQLQTIPDQYAIIDIRSAADYAIGHVKGAVNIPYGPDIATQLDEIQKMSAGKILVISCYTGQTSSQIVSALNLLDIDTNSLDFGAGKGLKKGWISEGYPVVK